MSTEASDIVAAAKSTTSFLSSAWTWIKQHWIAVVLVLAIIGASYKIAMSNLAMTDAIETQRQQILDSHNQIEGLEDALSDERAAREELQRSFDARINEIDARYADEIEDIRRTRVRRIRELTNNPEELDRQIDERFGLAH